MSWVFPPPERPFVPVAGGGRFPVGRVWCIGRNYAAHARELGHDEREPPFWFAKAASAICPAPHDEPAEVAFPPETSNLHHEVELVVALGQGGRGLTPAEALDCVWGYAVGLDLTRRDLQEDARRERRPWTAAKDFDRAAPIGRLLPRAAVGPLDRGRVALAVNGVVRQDGDLADMVWSVPDLLARLSRSFTLAKGDLIFTGTPAGVGPLQPGDRVEGMVEGLSEGVLIHVVA
jgi:fumarylpyruvate hydrolase